MLVDWLVDLSVAWLLHPSTVAGFAKQLYIYIYICVCVCVCDICCLYLQFAPVVWICCLYLLLISVGSICWLYLLFVSVVDICCLYLLFASVVCICCEEEDAEEEAKGEEERT